MGAVAPTFSVLIASHGDMAWADLAWARAYPSAFRQANETLVLHRPRGTLAQTRNELAAAAKGDWLVFLDADDELAPGYIDAMRWHLDIMEPSPLQLLAPAVSYVQPGQPPEPPKFWPHGQRDMLRSGNWLVIGTAVHRDVFRLAGGFKEWPIYEDWDLWQRCVLIASAAPTKVPEAVYVAHVTRDSRNEGLTPDQRLDVHQAIIRCNYGG